MQIVGYKGGKGGGGGHTPIEMPDSLRSKAYARFIDVISCGEIEGPINGTKSVYFGDVVLEDEKGKVNFADVAIEWRNGAVRQAPSSICETMEITSDVNIEVKNSKPIIHSVTAPEADIVRVTINVPTLTNQNKENGDISGTEVELKVEYQPNGGQWVDVGHIKISGKSTSAYNREHSFRLSGNSPWNVRVTRLTDDSSSQVLQNKTIWSKLTTVFEEKLIYPGIAYVAVQIDAEQFNSIPNRGYECRGIKVRVPNNYDPITRQYRGNWNGTFKIAWSDNPVWVYFDLITNEIYGAGEYIKDDMIDKWSLYKIAQYCDELVPDGFGGVEPRFTCNVYLQTRSEAYKLLKDLTSVFRAMSYWASGTLALVQDCPRDPIYQFNNTNVVDGTFSRTGSNIKNRHNVALVTWNDPKNRYKQTVEYVEDSAAIDKMGYVSETEVVAFGCTSRGQARRLGKWLLYTEQYESEIITFSCGQDGVIPMPGEVIQVSDVHRAGERRGGRVKRDSTINQIYIDSPIKISPNSTLSIINRNGQLEQRLISSFGLTDVVNVSQPFSSVTEDSTWIIASQDLEPELYRVVSIMEGENGIYTITASDYNPSKFNYIEQEELIYNDTSNSTLNTGVKDIVISDEIYRGMAGNVQTKIVVSYTPSTPLTSRYQIEYREGNGNWKTLEPTSLTSVDIPNVKDGIEYQIRIRTSNVLGVWSKSDDIYHYKVLGRLRPPHDVTGLKSRIIAQEGVFLTWDIVVDLDLDFYEIREGMDFEESKLVTKIKANEYNLGFISKGLHRYWLRAIDASGIYSENVISTDVEVETGSIDKLNSEIVGEDILLTWSETIGASFATDVYEIYCGQNLLVQVKGTSFKFKADFSGSKDFSIKALNLGGDRSQTTHCEILIHNPNKVIMSQQVIDNYVMLRWTSAQTTLPIVYYELRKGNEFERSDFITNIDGLAFPQFETVGGNYKYWIVGVDSAGNRGEPRYTLANVSQPPDYILKYDYFSDYSGKLNNAKNIGGKIYLPLLNQTWREHFAKHHFNSPQEQIKSGLPLYLQPIDTDIGYYEEEIDYGTILASSKITLTPKIISSGQYQIAYYIAVKTHEHDNWREHKEQSVYETNFRYMKYRLTVSHVTCPVIIEGINVKLDQKQKTDGGRVLVSASDVKGTWVDFSMNFIDASVPVLTPRSTKPLFAVSDFKDEPYPKGFYVFLFDTQGHRVSGEVGWVVKGV